MNFDVCIKRLKEKSKEPRGLKNSLPYDSIEKVFREQKEMKR